MSDAPTPTTPPSRRRSFRLSIAILMFLIAGLAVGLAAWDDICRTQVVFTNNSGMAATSVTLELAGGTIQLGPVPPGSTARAKIRASPSGVLLVRTAFASSEPRATSEISTSSVRPGGLVEVSVDGGGSARLSAPGTSRWPCCDRGRSE